MWNKMRNRFTSIVLVSLGTFVVGLNLSANGQEAKQPAAPAQKTTAAEQAPSTQQLTLKATLLDADENAKQKMATVQVEVMGLQLIDPALTNKMANKTQGHIHYQVDDGPIIATPATKLSFHGLTTGKHTIKIVLAANDHTALGPEQTIEVTVP